MLNSRTLLLCLRLTVILPQKTLVSPRDPGKRNTKQRHYVQRRLGHVGLARGSCRRELTCNRSRKCLSPGIWVLNPSGQLLPRLSSWLGFC